MNVDEEPEDLASWYVCLKDVPFEEVRRVICLHIAVATKPKPEQLVPLARAVELFLTGNADGLEKMIPKTKVN